MTTNKELEAAGYRNSTGLRYGANVDIWVKHENDGGISIILQDTTTGATADPFYAVSTRPAAPATQEELEDAIIPAGTILTAAERQLILGGR